MRNDDRQNELIGWFEGGGPGDQIEPYEDHEPPIYEEQFFWDYYRAVHAIYHENQALDAMHVAGAIDEALDTIKDRKAKYDDFGWLFDG